MDRVPIRRSDKGPVASPEDELSRPDDELWAATVPPSLYDVFVRGQRYVQRFFASRTEDPAHGTITIAGERYILVRAASMSVEFFDLVASLYRDKGKDAAYSVAKNILYDLAHSIGCADAKVFQARMGVTDPVERVSAGPVHFALSGWAHVVTYEESNPVASEDHYAFYDHVNSFEADAWIKRGTRADAPVCVMGAGYSSGWCEECFGVSLVAVEVECRAMGDPRCRFLMASPKQIEGRIADYMARSKRERSATAWKGPSPSRAIEIPEFFQRKRMEDALRASYEELEARVRERTEALERANAALQEEMAERQRAAEERRRLEAQMRETQKLESLGVLAGGIAHDFNNLLVGILGNAGLALSEVGEGTRLRECIRDIEAGAVRASDLVRQMLVYAGKGRLVVERVELSRLVQEMAHLLAAAISKKAAFCFEPAEPGPVVEGDATQLRQVVMNLLTNASDALGDSPGEIRVRTGTYFHDGETLISYSNEPIASGQYGYIEVSDTGGGMDQETLGRIFDPFFTTKPTGHGLGLASVLGIVRAHRGAIQVKSAPSKGSTFRVLIPLWTSSAPAACASSLAMGEMPRLRGTVLVADDELLARDVVRRVLEACGLRVVVASDGEEAILAYEQRRGEIDLAILDLTMPKKSGVEAFAVMRELSPRLKAILTSGFARGDSAEGYERLGFASFVAKPYRVEELIEQVCRALR
jgi:signal transduction histidine kinase/CheY-like chemotaxis protein/predicted hydrocarbon binding protein